jgi:hypothetical protein
MTRVALIAIGAGLASAVFYLAFRSGVPGMLALTYLAPVPLVAAGLGAGFVSAAIATAIATTTLLAGMDARVAGLYLVATAIPALIVSWHAIKARTDEITGTTEWYPIGQILGWLTIYGLILLAGAVLYFADGPDGLEGACRAFLRNFFDHFKPAGADNVKFPVDEIARYFPGMLISVWLLITMVDSVLAQNLLARAQKSLRPTPAYRQFEIPRWLEFAFLAAIIASFLPGTAGMLGRNAAPVLSTPFFLLGLAVIHTLSQRISARGAVLAGVYFLLVIVGWLTAIIVLLGLVEQWISLRRRFSAPGAGTQENE